MCFNTLPSFKLLTTLFGTCCFDRLLYATKAEGAQVLRPWMLGWRQDFGCSGYHEPEQASMIVELMLLEGFLGCEFVGMFLQNLKICVSLLCFLFDFLLCVLQVHDRCKHSGGGENLCLHSPKGLPGFILLGIAFDDWRPESVRGINAAFVVRFCSVCKIFI